MFRVYARVVTVDRVWDDYKPTIAGAYNFSKTISVDLGG